MEAKEKAYELAMKFDREGETDNAKKCALIAVDEIYILDNLKVGRYEGEKSPNMYYSFWEDVKEEINNL